MKSGPKRTFIVSATRWEKFSGQFCIQATSLAEAKRIAKTAPRFLEDWGGGYGLRGFKITDIAFSPYEPKEQP